MGFASFKNNQFYERTLLFITDPSRRPYAHYLQAVPLGGVLCFTFIQLICWAIIFGITSSRTPAAVAFPMFILLLVPLRLWLIPRVPYFKRQWLDSLDAASVVSHLRDDESTPGDDAGEEENEEEDDDDEEKDDDDEEEEEDEDEGGYRLEEDIASMTEEAETAENEVQEEKSSRHEE